MKSGDNLSIEAFLNRFTSVRLELPNRKSERKFTDKNSDSTRGRVRLVDPETFNLDRDQLLSALNAPREDDLGEAVPLYISSFYFCNQSN